ncbi:MAG: transposase [Chloroflexi bacterium]|nr:transposase [Chloroflexota bacterium]
MLLAVTEEFGATTGDLRTREASLAAALSAEIAPTDVARPLTETVADPAMGATLARRLLLSGVTTAEVEELLRRLGARGSAHRQVPELLREIDAEVGRFHHRVLQEDVQYLSLSGVRVWISNGAGIESRHLLCAYGVTAAGARLLIDFRLVSNENMSAWIAFLAKLEARGLNGRSLSLATAPAGSPARTALDVVWPDVRRQQCWSTALLHARLIQREYGPTTCVNDLAAVMCAPTSAAALLALSRWARTFRAEAPAVVEYVRRNADELTVFLEFPPAVRECIRSVEPVRRLLQGVRARANPMVTFESPESCERVVYGLILSSRDGGRVDEDEAGSEGPRTPCERVTPHRAIRIVPAAGDEGAQDGSEAAQEPLRGLAT